MSTDIQKLRRRDNLLQEIAERKRLRQSQIDMENIKKSLIQQNNVRLVKKVFVDLYQPNYQQQELL